MTLPLYELTGSHTADEVSQLLETNGINGKLIETDDDRIYVQTADEENGEEFEVVFAGGFIRAPASKPRRKRGKNMTTADYVEILNADGTPAEIAEQVGRSVGTVKNVLKMMPIADVMWRRLWVEERLIEAGVIKDRDGMFPLAPTNEEIAAVVGLHHWRKIETMVNDLRAKSDSYLATLADIARLERENEGMELVNGCLERHIDRGGKLH